jgi:B-cell receptor-associated protein 31
MDEKILDLHTAAAAKEGAKLAMDAAHLGKKAASEIYTTFFDPKASIQWTAVALIMYVEIILCLILLVPWIPPTLWKKFFLSRPVLVIRRYTHIYSTVIIAVLALLFADSIREVRKYSKIDVAKGAGVGTSAETDSLAQMRSFLAQRNLFISGFALLFYLMLKRLVSLVSRSANLEIVSDVAMKHAETAEETTRTLIESKDTDEAVKKLTIQVQKLEKERDCATLENNELKDKLGDLQMEYERICTHLKAAESGEEKKGK